LQRYRGYPDLFIAEPNAGFAGLFLEIKRPGTRIFKKDGTLVSDEHIREQFDMLADLRKRGYAAEFACGIDEVTEIIEEYLSCED
jgi:hypothetical protein